MLQSIIEADNTYGHFDIGWLVDINNRVLLLSKKPRAAAEAAADSELSGEERDSVADTARALEIYPKYVVLTTLVAKERGCPDYNKKGSRAGGATASYANMAKGETPHHGDGYDILKVTPYIKSLALHLKI